MPAKVIEDLDYADLLKDEGKNVKVWLPKTTLSGDTKTLGTRISAAVKAEDVDYTNQPLSGVGIKGKYASKDRWGYGRNWRDYFVVEYTRSFTAYEIEKSGPTLYKAVVKRRAAIEKKRKENIRKLNQLQRDLGVDVQTISE